MNNIEAVIAKRVEHEAAREHQDALLQLMDRRNYPERIQKLENDIMFTLKNIQVFTGNPKKIFILRRVPNYFINEFFGKTGTLK